MQNKFVALQVGEIFRPVFYQLFIESNFEKDCFNSSTLCFYKASGKNVVAIREQNPYPQDL